MFACAIAHEAKRQQSTATLRPGLLHASLLLYSFAWNFPKHPSKLLAAPISESFAVILPTCLYTFGSALLLELCVPKVFYPFVTGALLCATAREIYQRFTR